MSSTPKPLFFFVIFLVLVFGLFLFWFYTQYSLEIKLFCDELKIRLGLAKMPPPCPVGEVVNATGYVYGPCQYDGPFKPSGVACDITMDIVSGQVLSCIASDGRYAVFKARLSYTMCWPPGHPRYGEPCPLALHIGDYVVFVDLRSGEAVATALSISEKDVVFGKDGVYLRGDRPRDFISLRVELDSTKLRIGQPVELVNGTMVKVPIRGS